MPALHDALVPSNIRPINELKAGWGLMKFGFSAYINEVTRLSRGPPRIAALPD